MNFLFLLMIVLGFFGVCLLAMAVGVILRNRSFTSCGNAGVTINGERINCPSCQDRGGEPPVARPCHRQPDKLCDRDGGCSGA